MNMYSHLIYPIIDLARRTDALKTFKYLNKAQWQSPEEIQELQRQSLAKLLCQCYQNVPFYRNVFDECDFKPWENITVADLQKLPVIDKETVQNNREQFKSEDWEATQPRWGSTGGTTSRALQFYISRATHSSTIASVMLQWQDAGYKLGDKMIYLGGASLYPGLGNLKTWLYHKLQRLVTLSSFDITEEHLRKYVKQIRKSKAHFLRGYASSIYVLAKYLIDNNITDLHIEAVFTTAETLFPHYRKTIQQAFGCEVYNEYGARDGGILAFECSQHTGLHINALTCLVEIVDDDNNLLPTGETGNVLLTSLDNYAFPFIRYKVGDRASISSEYCPCGRGLPMLEHVEGRSGDFVITPSGMKIHSEFFSHIFWEFPAVKQFQIRQKQLNNIEILIASNNGNLKDEDINKIKSIVSRRCEHSQVKIHQVAEIPQTASGKWRYVVSELDNT
ncbi:phenylacetate--CoA ligase family protein [Candidatus Poribacteria bacterium]|nr:phenylacetate--CoA ligase family protein [Candidatus Poribacteria bacterium]